MKTVLQPFMLVIAAVIIVAVIHTDEGTNDHRIMTTSSDTGLIDDLLLPSLETTSPSAFCSTINEMPSPMSSLEKNANELTPAPSFESTDPSHTSRIAVPIPTPSPSQEIIVPTAIPSHSPIILASTPTPSSILEGTAAALTPTSISTDLDVTSKLQLLGNPFNKAIYARNVWDMQVFNGSIYLGYGNSSNYGPSSNAGPIDVIKYDPDKNKFQTEYTVNEEQIDVFRVINNQLYIPGHDPRDSWDFGNYYTYNGQWTKIRTVPKAVHIYDMAFYNGNLYAATGTDGFGEVVSSNDNGQTWSPVSPTDGTVFKTWSGRAYTLFTLKGVLYSSSAMMNNNTYELNNVLIISRKDVSAKNISGTKMFPGLSGSHFIKIIRPITVNKNLLFIAGKVNNDHQYLPLALYVSSDIGISKKVNLGETSALPYDIIQRGSITYVLASTENTSGSYTNIVYSSTDLSSWAEVLRFQSDTFARSFEELSGYFYFGLGCDTKILPESTGNIIRVAIKDITPVPTK